MLQLGARDSQMAALPVSIRPVALTADRARGPARAEGILGGCMHASLLDRLGCRDIFGRDAAAMAAVLRTMPQVLFYPNSYVFHLVHPKGTTQREET